MPWPKFFLLHEIVFGGKMKLICWATLRHGLLTSKQLATPQLLQKLGVITVHSDSLTHHLSAKVRTLKDITTLAFQDPDLTPDPNVCRLSI